MCYNQFQLVKQKLQTSVTNAKNVVLAYGGMPHFHFLSSAGLGDLLPVLQTQKDHSLFTIPIPSYLLPTTFLFPTLGFLSHTTQVKTFCKTDFIKKSFIDWLYAWHQYTSFRLSLCVCALSLSISQGANKFWMPVLSRCCVKW